MPFHKAVETEIPWFLLTTSLHFSPPCPNYTLYITTRQEDFANIHRMFTIKNAYFSALSAPPPLHNHHKKRPYSLFVHHQQKASMFFMQKNGGHFPPPVERSQNRKIREIFQENSSIFLRLTALKAEKKRRSSTFFHHTKRRKMAKYAPAFMNFCPFGHGKRGISRPFRQRE